MSGTTKKSKRICYVTLKQGFQCKWTLLARNCEPCKHKSAQFENSCAQTKNLCDITGTTPLVTILRIHLTNVNLPAYNLEIQNIFVLLHSSSIKGVRLKHIKLNLSSNLLQFDMPKKVLYSYKTFAILIRKSSRYTSIQRIELEQLNYMVS